MKAKEILDIINTYDTLINSFMTLVTIIVGIIAIVQTRRIAKKDHEMSEREAIINKQQYEEGLRAQREQLEIQLERAEEVERIQEQPYLVFKEARISEKSDARVKRIDMNFVNKGRGAAYDIIPVLECTAKTMDGEAMLRRADAIQDPIAMVGEKFNTLWTLGYGTEVTDFTVSIPINYTDASGRKYVQVFDIIFHKEGYASVTNFANPELC
ncbi:MAG: hypothetical protein SO445_03545 [Lachnospiraceae bacterium]|nr:hypothetical protein [Lachnospiraceae bacterium]